MSLASGLCGYCGCPGGGTRCPLALINSLPFSPRFRYLPNNPHFNRVLYSVQVRENQFYQLGHINLALHPAAWGVNLSHYDRRFLYHPVSQFISSEIPADAAKHVIVQGLDAVDGEHDNNYVNAIPYMGHAFSLQMAEPSVQLLPIAFAMLRGFPGAPYGGLLSGPQCTDVSDPNAHAQSATFDALHFYGLRPLDECFTDDCPWHSAYMPSGAYNGRGFVNIEHIESSMLERLLPLINDGVPVARRETPSAVWTPLRSVRLAGHLSRYYGTDERPYPDCLYCYSHTHLSRDCTRKHVVWPAPHPRSSLPPAKWNPGDVVTGPKLDSHIEWWRQKTAVLPEGATFNPDRSYCHRANLLDHLRDVLYGDGFKADKSVRRYLSRELGISYVELNSDSDSD